MPRYNQRNCSRCELAASCPVNSLWRSCFSRRSASYWLSRSTHTLYKEYMFEPIDLLKRPGFAGCESPGFAPANLLQQPEPVRKASERNRQHLSCWHWGFAKTAGGDLDGHERSSCSPVLNPVIRQLVGKSQFRLRLLHKEIFFHWLNYSHWYTTILLKKFVRKQIDKSAFAQFLNSTQTAISVVPLPVLCW